MGDEQAMLYVVPVNVGATTTLDLLGLTAEEQIAATYVAFFGRGADALGFGFWVGEFVRGLPVQGPAALFANIASSFGISDEAKALYPFWSAHSPPATPRSRASSSGLRQHVQSIVRRGGPPTGPGRSGDAFRRPVRRLGAGQHHQRDPELGGRTDVTT
jgi:hypothetical protein